MRRPLSIICSVVFAGACASAEKKPLWDDLPADNTVRAKAAPPDPSRVAAESLSATECTLRAKTLHADDPALGWAVMRECIRRTDYVDLPTLAAPPWRHYVYGKWELLDEALLICVRRNSDDVSKDLEQIGLSVTPLSFNAVPTNPSNVLYSARVRIRERTGGTRWKVEELVFDGTKSSGGSSRYPSYYYYSPYSPYGSGKGGPSRALPSGVTLPVDAGGCVFAKNEDVQLIARFKSAGKSARLSDVDGEPVLTCVVSVNTDAR